MKAIILARVSTKEQEDQGHSIPAQLASLRKYADQKGFTVVKEFSFSESAGPKIRTKFEEVLQYLKDNKDVHVMLCENVDRATRNFRDAVDLDDMRINHGLEIHFVKDGFYINSEATGNQMFMWEAKVFIGKQYLNRLSDDVKRSIRSMLENGEWPGHPPIGYIRTEDEDGIKNIVLDPRTAHLIKKVFELYSTGKVSVRTLKEEMGTLGLTSKNGKKLSPGMIYHTLCNPFYIGIMVSKGTEYTHKYEHLISRDLFNRCKAVRAGHEKKPFQHKAKPFTFRGLIKCANCGCTITPEIKKGRFIYYSCTNFKRICTKVYVPEKTLLKPVYEALEAIQMPKERIDELTAELKKLGRSEAVFHKDNMDALHNAYEVFENRISKMQDDKYDGRITQENYDKKLKEYKEKQTDILNQMKDHSEGDHQFYLTANAVFNLATRAIEIFESSEAAEKRQLLNFLLQNCTLSGSKLVFELKEPFNLIVATRHQPIGLPG